jgi:chromosome segregation ATPase
MKMEIVTDQIAKRLDWLDEERRKDRATIAALEQRLAAQDGNYNLLKEQLKELKGEVSRTATISARMDQYDGVLSATPCRVARMIVTG